MSNQPADLMEVSGALPELAVEHFSKRFGLIVRGAKQPFRDGMEASALMPPGIYVSVQIRGKTASGAAGDEKPIRNHGMTGLAVREATDWRASIGVANVEVLGVAMELAQIRACGLEDQFSSLFQEDENIRQFQRAASFRAIDQARRALASDLTDPLQVLRLEADVLDIFLEGVQGLRARSENASSRSRGALLSLSDDVEADLGRDWTMSDLARSAGMSARSLSTRFRSEFGCTPFAFLRERRLLRARDLVADSDMSFGAIAGLVGFGTAAHFSTAFKQRFGRSPMAFRQDPDF
ncbi:hypothetical protein A33O_15196 [Nitratireductor aquibiodomus RA22]|uniref:HTH araC/xylS-type domain-containing protein n=1 Tax=Nitratireductor aquibiodomus RA22 TaxID=1189611 RepID=I5BVD2_9HYPH|nr:helix-turn-helix transcriptional regulator [Nitratireductor aquibiodomus]EIM73534.1 hypothetical protein A33O_15196 [Nitratireductor aquibiodomus RA22]